MIQESIEVVCDRIYSSFPPESPARMGVAVAFGYFDAKMMCFYRETHGLAFVDQLPVLRERFPSTKVPYLALRLELASMGKRASSVDAELAELSSFDLLSRGK